MPATPDYIRISDEIIDDIRSGRYKAGDKLPSIAQLCERYRVSPSTIQLVNVAGGAGGDQPSPGQGRLRDRSEDMAP